MKDLSGVFYTFSDNMADLYDLMTKNIVGGHPPGITRIHPLWYGEQTVEVSGSVTGRDCNSLYPHSMAHVMPIQHCVVCTFYPSPRGNIAGGLWNG